MGLDVEGIGIVLKLGPGDRNPKVTPEVFQVEFDPLVHFIKCESYGGFLKLFSEL